jgi:nucleoside-diphosphate-sugar epimerase
MGPESNILVTGVNSGLGKYCRQYFESTGLSRHSDFDELRLRAERQPYRAIVHCAFNAKPTVNQSQLYSYLNDTTLLVRKLLQIPHEKFIFISSTDVYNKNDDSHVETDEIELKADLNLYAVSKLIAESLVQNETDNALILRTTALLGKDARPNSLIKILTQADVSLTLMGASTFNYILHSDVAAFIEKAMAQDLKGIYNLAAASNIALQEVSNYYQRAVQFGNYHYTTGKINNEKSISIMSNFARTSLENIDLFRTQDIVSA